MRSSISTLCSCPTAIFTQIYFRLLYRQPTIFTRNIHTLSLSAMLVSGLAIISSTDPNKHRNLSVWPMQCMNRLRKKCDHFLHLTWLVISSCAASTHNTNTLGGITIHLAGSSSPNQPHQDLVHYRTHRIRQRHDPIQWVPERVGNLEERWWNSPSHRTCQQDRGVCRQMPPLCGQKTPRLDNLTWWKAPWYQTFAPA